MAFLRMRGTLRWQSTVCIWFIPIDGVPSNESFFPYPGPGSRENAAQKPKNLYAKYSRADAEVWSRYLDETRAEDKSLIQLWKSRRDPLLVSISCAS